MRGGESCGSDAECGGGLGRREDARGYVWEGEEGEWGGDGGGVWEDVVVIRDEGSHGRWRGGRDYRRLDAQSEDIIWKT